MAGCSHVTVGKIERDRQQTSIDVAEGLSAALGVSPTFMAFGHEGFFPFREKRPVPETPPEDPTPRPTEGAYRERYKGMPERLKRTREKQGRTIRGLAALANLSPAGIVSVEEGRTVASLQTCEQLAKALDVSPGWLAYGEGQGPEEESR